MNDKLQSAKTVTVFKCQFKAYFLAHSVVNCGICYQNVCLSVRLSVTLLNRA